MRIRKMWWIWVVIVAVGLFMGGFYLLSTADSDLVEASPDDFAKELFVHDYTNLYSTDAFTVHLPLVMRHYPPPPSVFGVEMRALTEGEGLTAAQEAEVKWVRLAAFPWDAIEPTQGVYNWDVVDEVSLERAATNDMEVIAVVKYTPGWAQKVEGSRCGPIKESALDDFARFLEEAVQRYGRSPYDVRYWELGNEPDVRANTNEKPWGCWGDDAEPYFGGEYYAEMLKVAYPAIKSADPNAKVMIGSLLLDCHPDHESLGLYCSPGRESSGKFLEGILHGGGGGYFDLVGFHAYAYPGSSRGEIWSSAWSQRQTTSIPEKQAFLQSVLVSYGYPDKGFMNTESALHCQDLIEDCLETQAMYVTRAYAEAIVLGLDSQVYYSMLSSWKNTSLLWPDTMEPKPVYEAYKVASSYLGSVNFVGATSYSGVEGYAFRSWRTGEHIEVVWSPDGGTYEVDLPTDAAVYDRYGETLATSGAVDIGPSPIYIVRQP